MLKKTLLAVAILALSAPAFADHGYREYRVVQRPVVVQPYYRPAPRPVYIVHRAPPPPPVYVHHSHADVGPALLFGAIIGAAVVHSVLSR